MVIARTIVSNEGTGAITEENMEFFPLESYGSLAFSTVHSAQMRARVKSFT